ncbi:hypothetical protein J6590_043461 [Homalodisca vitripennis]|nr:hypothetical protein J6590_043461 [Homalodisca vitripennis]
MRKLIGQFQRESKKGKSGSGAIGSKWYAFDTLLFIQDKCAPRQTAEVGLQPQHTEHEVPEAGDADGSACDVWRRLSDLSTLKITFSISIL